MSAAQIENFLLLYFFPLQFVIGVSGNLVSLIVLLDRRVGRLRTLAAAAATTADMRSSEQLAGA